MIEPEEIIFGYGPTTKLVTNILGVRCVFKILLTLVEIMRKVWWMKWQQGNHSPEIAKSAQGEQFAQESAVLQHGVGLLGRMTRANALHLVGIVGAVFA